MGVYSQRKIADKTYEVHLTATINGNWHMYAQNVGVDGPRLLYLFLPKPIVDCRRCFHEMGKMIKKNEEV